MDSDLEDYHRKNTQLQVRRNGFRREVQPLTALEVNIKQLTNKHKSLQEDIVSQRKKMTDCQTAAWT